MRTINDQCSDCMQLSHDKESEGRNRQMHQHASEQKPMFKHQKREKISTHQITQISLVLTITKQRELRRVLK